MNSHKKHKNTRKQMSRFFVPFCALLWPICFQSAMAIEPSEIDYVLNQTPVRQVQALLAQESSPYPSTGMWHYEDYALAAYWLNISTDDADDGLILISTNGMYDADVADLHFHWNGYLLGRIYFLFSGQSEYFPGRMSVEAENAVLEMLWGVVSDELEMAMFDPDSTFMSWGSENHDAQNWVTYWGAAQIFAGLPVYSTYTYKDGTTAADMAVAANEYFKVYCRERALKGTEIEINSPTYAKYTLNTWLNLADFATDPELKALASSLLDIYWAQWAMEQLNAVRGGSRHRSYSGGPSIAQTSADGHAWYLFGRGKVASQHPGDACASTTFWRPSRAVVGLALDEVGRGEYSSVSRRLGHRDPSPPALPPNPLPGSGFDYNTLDPDGGHLLRTSWCTPDFVMGMSMMDVLPDDDWIAFSSQNHWNGIIFAGDAGERIFTQRPNPGTEDDVKSVYNAEWGVQNKGAMVLQHTSKAQNSIGQMIWFDFDLNRAESGGWIFAEAPNAYAAVKVVDGTWSWQLDAPEFHRDYSSNTNVGEWVVLNNKYSPIIIEAARKQDYTSFTAFQAEILGNPLVWANDRLDYTSTGYGTTLTLFADESARPRIDGVPVDLEPKENYISPYLQGDYAGGPVIITYGDDRTIHGVAPFAEDTNTIAHWDFETTLPVIHSDSTDSIQLIADGKFGGAIRCSFEDGDQYMMTANAWPTNQGTFRYQGWIRLNAGDTGGYLFHVYDQVYLSVDTSEVTFKINRSGDLEDTSATNVIELAASISSANEWQYIEAVYDGDRIKLVTEVETVSATGIGAFVPNVRTVNIGSRKNRNNFVGDMDEVKVSSSITDESFIPAPVAVSATAQHLQKSDPDIDSNTIVGFTPAIGPETKLVLAASWESGAAVITNVSFGGQSFTEAVYREAGRHAALWYLDEPVAASGDVVVHFSEPTDSRIGVLSLQNAAAGGPDRTATTTLTTNIGLTTLVKDSLTVGVYTENGAAVLSSDFANTLYSGDSGSSVGNAGYQLEADPGAKTYTWDAVNYSGAAVAASFPPASYIPPIVAGDDSDSDADGMADAWEVQQFGSVGAVDGTADADGDLFTDAQEFIAGTDPFDADSHLRITGVSDGLRWKSVQGKRYRILSSTNLTDGAWMVEAFGVPGGFSESSHPVTNANDTVYLKVEVE